MSSTRIASMRGGVEDAAMTTSYPNIENRFDRMKLNKTQKGKDQYDRTP